MRPFRLITNFFVLLAFVLSYPFRLLRARRRPMFIRFTVEGDLPWRDVARRRLPFTARPDPTQALSLESLRVQLAALANDARVQGIILSIKDTALPPAKMDTLRRLLEGFRATGKRVVGHAVAASNADYEALCLTDWITLPSGGRVDLTGFAVETTHLAKALKRFGVTAHFIRRGDYKTAPELFTHESLSDIQRQTLEALVDDRYRRLVTRVAAGRKLTELEVQAKVDGGPYSARRAVAEGLVDALVSEADLPKYLGKGTDAVIGAYGAWERAHPAAPPAWRPLRRRVRVGLVKLDGMIVSGKTGGFSPMGRLAPSEVTCRQLRAASEDSRVAAVVFQISSPGGSAIASEEILEEARRAAQKKPLIAYCERVAASGGYMAALGAQEIWSDPHAILGSIGVFAGKFDVSALLARVGISRSVIQRGAHAAIFSSTRGLNESERAALEAEVEETYQAFLEHVAVARKQTRAEVHSKAEGRVFSGERARALGLVDSLGGLEEAAVRALELAGVRGREFDFASYGGKLAQVPWVSLLQRLGGAQLYTLMWPTWRFILPLPHQDGGGLEGV